MMVEQEPYFFTRFTWAIMIRLKFVGPTLPCPNKRPVTATKLNISIIKQIRLRRLDRIGAVQHSGADMYGF